MFNQLDVREQDMHLRRIYVCPDGFGGKEPWKIAVVAVVNFGEKAAGNLATAVKNRTAKDNEQISPEVSKMIRKDCFMDDVNVKAKYNENLDDNIKKAEEIMALGGFTFKEWVKSGSECQREIAKELARALGVYWRTGGDKILYKVRINFGKKVRNRRDKLDSTVETIADDFPKNFTQRLALKIAHSVFDPPILVQPFL